VLRWALPTNELYFAGKDCAEKSTLPVPAVAEPRISKAPEKPSVVGWKLAIPLMSEITVDCEEARMTGVGSWVMVVSPPDVLDPLLSERSTVDWNTTLAPCTAFGGVEKSVT